MAKVRKNENNTADLARIAHAWARMNTVTRENDNLKLRKQEAIDVGLEAIAEEFKKKPEVLGASNQFREVVKRAENEK